MATIFRSGFRPGGRSPLGPKGTYATVADKGQAGLTVQTSVQGEPIVRLLAHGSRGGYPLPTLSEYVAAGYLEENYEKFLADERSAVPPEPARADTQGSHRFRFGNRL